jgi:hypothetical protein
MSNENAFSFVPFSEDGSASTTLWTALSGLVLAVLFRLLYLQFSKKFDGFNYLPGIPIIGSWSFFTRRADFLSIAIAANRTGKTSKFNILNVIVIPYHFSYDSI